MLKKIVLVSIKVKFLKPSYFEGVLIVFSALAALALINGQPQRYPFRNRPFHKTLPSSSAFVYWISVRFYETVSCLYF